MIYAGILAGGQGTRMKYEDMPKQFLDLGGRPILIHTIEQFLLHSGIGEIVVALPRPWVSYSIDLVRRNFPSTERLRLIPGGDSRNESLMAIVSDIEQRHGLQASDVIISHDAVRPFVSTRILQENMDAVQQYGAVDTVIPAYDTIVASEDGELISHIPPRSTMYQGQTPQSFQIQRLKELYAGLTEVERASLTDAASIFVLRGQPVHLVQGDPSNLKITTDYDLKVARALLGSGSHD